MPKHKPSQTDLPGVEGPGVAPKKIPAIEKCASRYIGYKDERCGMLTKEISEKRKLIELILEHKDEIGVDSNGEVIYRYDSHLISVKPGEEKLKIVEVGDTPSGE